MLEEGESAPDFELPNQDGDPVSLADYEGQTVVLYFYPMAGTAGCTREARAFDEEFDGFEERDATVLGVSTDSVADVAEFHASHGFPFDLLSDEDGSVALAYGTYGEPEMDGEVYEIAYRHTYVVDGDGTVAAVYEDVSPETHAGEVLADLDEAV